MHHAPSAECGSYRQYYTMNTKFWGHQKGAEYLSGCYQKTIDVHKE